MDNKTVSVMTAFALGIILSGFIISTAVNNRNLGVMKIMGIQNANSPVASNPIDAHFIEQMIPHHEDAITMAKLALTKAKHPEIKALAQNIIDSQGKEINQMKSWYKEWFGRELPTGKQMMGQHGMMEDETNMVKLEQLSDFDKAFIDEMIPHHQMAVMMASMLKNGTQRSEMKKLADDIITAQTKEIDQMREWYRSW